MDPNTNLKDQLALSKRIMEEHDKESPDADLIAHLANELAELVTSLHMWIKGGGFLPSDWKRAK